MRKLLRGCIRVAGKQKAGPSFFAGGLCPRGNIGGIGPAAVANEKPDKICRVLSSR